MPGLLLAWSPEVGVTTDGNGITAVAPDQGTLVPLSASGTNEPDLIGSVGPHGQPLFEFTEGATEFFSFAATTLTAFTIFVALALRDTTGASALFGRSSSTQCHLQIANGGGNATVSTINVRTLGGVSTNVALPIPLNRTMRLLAVTYSNAGGGPLTPYVDGVAGAPVDIGTAGFTFNRLGVLSTSTSPFDGYMGPVLVYDGVLSASEIAAVFAFLAPWYASRIYIAPNGDDTSETPWSQATPWASIDKGFEALCAGQTVAPKGGADFRSAVRLTPATAGLVDKRCAIDGGLWGSGKARVRFSTAPALSLVSGTVYDAGALSDEPVGYVFYVPGGTPTFAATYQTNVVRLTKDSATPTTPAAGKWGYDTGNLYVNAGVALVQGDIEVSVPGLVIPILIGHPYWDVRSIINAFAEDRGFQFGESHQIFEDCECWFVQSDGFDGIGVCTGNIGRRLKALYCGRAPTVAGAFGDGFSWHETAQVDFEDCEAWWNDKSGYNHQSGTITTHRRCRGVGSMAFRLNNDSEGGGVYGGSMLLENCIADVPNGALDPDGIQNNALGASSLTARHCTVYSRSAVPAGKGVEQTSALAPVTVQNVIVKGFATGLSAASGAVNFTANHNCLQGNGANYANVSAGAGDVTGDPLFTDPAAFGLDLAAGSPCHKAGVDLAIAADFAGRARPQGSPPDIGAYESHARRKHGSWRMARRHKKKRRARRLRKRRTG